MPIYEYQCEKCDHQFDALQKISEKPLKKCPECGKKSLTKLISAAGFRLKGGGWYETDFKSGNKKNLAKTEGSDGATDSSSDSSEKSSSGGSDSASSANSDKTSKNDKSGKSGKSSSGKNGAKSGGKKTSKTSS